MHLNGHVNIYIHTHTRMHVYVIIIMIIMIIILTTTMCRRTHLGKIETQDILRLSFETKLLAQTRILACIHTYKRTHIQMGSRHKYD
jgi:hypothetical protein